jgi:anti-anti-sigma factor
MSVLRENQSNRARGTPPVPDLIAARADRLVLTCSCTAVSLSSPAGEVIVVRVVGEVDMSTVSCVRDALDDSLARGPCDLVVDLAAMTFCGVRGLDLLVRAGITAADLGIGYSVAAAPARTCRMWPVLWAGEVPRQVSSAGAAILVAMARHAVDTTARWAPQRGPGWVRRWPAPQSCVHGASRLDPASVPRTGASPQSRATGPDTHRLSSRSVSSSGIPHP